MSQNPAYAIVTVTTESYFQWTMTMLYSFVRSNPWFKGDMVVICRNLPEALISDLHLLERVIVVEPSLELLKKLDLVADKVPEFNKILPRFYSLEIFRLRQYQKLVFLDSDMIVVKSIEEVFSLPDTFYACAQLCYYKGKGRNASTFNAEFQGDEKSNFLENPINTGFMMLDEELLNQGHYHSLIELITPELWINNKLTYTDELIINLHFNGRISLLDTRYNYRARAARIVSEKEHVAFEDAKIIHFYAHFKPWNFSDVLESSSRNLHWIKAYELWYKAYIDFLTFYHLQKKIARFTPLKQTPNE